MFPRRVRNTYLESTPITDVTAATYHGACGLRIIVTISAVRAAPLGNSHRPLFTRRMTASRSPAASTAAPSSGATSRTPSCGAASTTRTARMIVSRPFGVAKNFLTASALRIAKAPRFEALQLGRHHEAVDAKALQELD